MNKTKQKLLILLVALFSLIQTTMSQVTIGDGAAPQKYSILEVVSGGVGGLRMPQLTTAQRDALKENDGSDFVKDANRTTPFLYEGLTIYNTTTRCIEYYNSTRWISMCSSSAGIFPTGDDTPVPASGGDKEAGVTDPDCSEAGEYKFEILSGGDYSVLTVTDAGQGKFKLEFLPNEWAIPRTAILMVISPCGNSGIFIYSQLGDATGCGTSPAFTISTNNGTNLCTTGAAYLYLTGAGVDAGMYIWTLNGKQVNVGTNYVATQSGKYIVYGDKIGCPNSQTITVSIGGGSAPAPVPIIVNGNNGLVCGPTGTAKLIAQKPATGTVRWFKDGVLQALTTPDNEIDATVGQWFAVVTDPSGCWSVPSDKSTVSVDPSTGTQLTMPEIVKPATFCAGSTVQLSVSDASYNVAYTYTWYANNTQVGSGKYLMYNVPTGPESVVIRCRATGGGCSAEAIGTETITAGTIPSRPVITGNTVLCSGQTTLNVVPTSSGTFTYAWYKDNELIGTSQSLSVTSGGDYYATVIDGCPSPQAKITIDPASSAVPTVTLSRSSETPNKNDVVTYLATINFNPAKTYTWTITNATLQSGGGNTPNAVVLFDQEGFASVKVAVSNACGEGEATHSIANVMPACADPATVSPQSPADKTTVEGSSATLGPVSATFTSGTPVAGYEWYRSTTLPTTLDGSHTSVGGYTNTLITDPGLAAGTYYYYCMVSNIGCASLKMASGVFKVTVNANPANLPIGSGMFSGKTCFDIAFSNDNTNECAALTSRTPMKTDFTDTRVQDPESGTSTAPYSGTQVYTFTPSGAVSNVRFMVIDPTGKVIASYTPNGVYTGNNISNPCKLTVVYKSSLNDEAKGLTRTNPLKADIYVIYNDNATNTGAERAIKVVANIQDCACCGAYIAAGVWKSFMCHNLGADQGVDPFSPAQGLHGAKYKWGAKDPSVTMAEDQSNSAAVANWTSLPSQTTIGSWSAANNPCPAGWRVPTQAEWNGVLDNTLNPRTLIPIGTWTAGETNYSTGTKYGPALFLPAAGYRWWTDGKLMERGSAGSYWASNEYTTSHALFLRMQSQATTNYYKTTGMSVRCIIE